ncbi:MAG: chlorophyll synthase ChlG [Parvularculaceae bacterium]|nr:chlorophyll synthase ChlG [Parvularculaceae bacterium]
MSVTSSSAPRRLWPEPSAVLELFKPVTWFAPMWAFTCGVISSGQALDGRWWTLFIGVLLVGPMVCAASQAANDWFDREVDAINEPNRPIPSGRIPGHWGLYIAIAWSAISLLLGASLGVWAFWATVLAVFLAWAYSMPPLRLKLNGWYGNAAVGVSYEGLAWFTGAAIFVSGAPAWPIVVLALLYSIGAHGIMTLNDFKAIEGDIRMNIRTLPVQLGPERAARWACIVMLLPQVAVTLLLIAGGMFVPGMIIVALMVGQAVLMRRLLTDPEKLAPWYNGTGVLMFVSGMMVAAVAVRGWGLA